MKPTTDKTVQVLKDQFDKLGDVETEANKRDVRETRRKLKQAIHKRERNVGKRQLRDLLTKSEEQE
jgi:hypothetical protein